MLEPKLLAGGYYTFFLTNREDRSGQFEHRDRLRIPEIEALVARALIERMSGDGRCNILDPREASNLLAVAEHPQRVCFLDDQAIDEICERMREPALALRSFKWGNDVEWSPERELDAILTLECTTEPLPEQF